MEADKILQADLLDLIFENRNKQYGAYVLRQNENRSLIKGMAVVLSITIILLLVYGFTTQTKSAKNTQTVETVLYHTAQDKPIAKEPEPVKPEKKNVQQVKQQAFISTIKIEANPIHTPLAKNLDSLEIGSTTINTTHNSPALVGIPKGIDSGSSKSTLSIPTTSTVVRHTADVMPSFPGGIEALRRFLQNNLMNPRELESNEEVEVKIQFVVGFDGNLKGFEVLKDGGKIFNDEVIRVLKKMPQWNPGKTNGENVSVYYAIPVKFISENQ